DSALTLDEVRRVENHGHRPEVLEALAQGGGSSVRHSATVHEDLLYTAVPIVARGSAAPLLAGRVLGVSRVALPLTDVTAQVAELRRAVAAALGLSFLIAGGLSAVLASSVTGTARE